MAETCKMRIKIADNPTYGIDHYGLYLAKSPSLLGCDMKDSNLVKIDFPEQDGDTFFIPDNPSRKSFDYPVTFLFFDNNLESANKAISEFYNSIFGKKVILFNDYKGAKIIGYALSYKDSSFYRNETDVVVFDINFYVPDPTLCDFNYAYNKVYYGTSVNTFTSDAFRALNASISKPITLNIPVGSTNVVFAWASELGEPCSVIQMDIGYEIKGIFTKSELLIKDDESDDTTLYNVYTFTPPEPFSLETTYKIV